MNNGAVTKRKELQHKRVDFRFVEDDATLQHTVANTCMTDVGLPEYTKEGRMEVGEGWIFLIYTLLVMMRMSFHKVVLVKVYGVGYGMVVVFPEFCRGFSIN